MQARSMLHSFCFHYILSVKLRKGKEIFIQHNFMKFSFLKHHWTVHNLVSPDFSIYAKMRPILGTCRIPCVWRLLSLPLMIVEKNTVSWWQTGSWEGTLMDLRYPADQTVEEELITSMVTTDYRCNFIFNNWLLNSNMMICSNNWYNFCNNW